MEDEGTLDEQMTNGDCAEKAEWIRSLVRRYEGPLVRYAARITCDIERARDVVQDTFLKLCGDDDPGTKEHVAEWLFTVCRNGALDLRRREKRMGTLSEVQAKGCGGRNPAPSAVMEDRETLGSVSKALETLPENQQEVVRLRFQCGLSYREIGRVANLSVTNVGFLIHTALKNVRRQLAVAGE